MKPTALQLQHAIKYSEWGVHIAWHQPTHVWLKELLILCDEPRLIRVMHRLTSFTEWQIPVRITAKSKTKLSVPDYEDLQVPIEPLESLEDCIVALTWFINESHPFSLVKHRDEPNLLCQAIEAGLPINRYNDTGLTNDKGEHIMELDKGSVLLAFELAGVEAPKVYDNWREPDGLKCPYRATSRWNPSLGTMQVHYTNGELALVTSGDLMRAELVHIKKLDDASPKELAGFLKTNRHGEAPKPKVELKEGEAQQLTAKFFRPKK